jgi:hypothetical protein
VRGALGREQPLAEHEPRALEDRALAEPGCVGDEHVVDRVGMRQLPHPVGADAEHGYVAVLPREAGEETQAVGAKQEEVADDRGGAGAGRGRHGLHGSALLARWSAGRSPGATAAPRWCRIRRPRLAKGLAMDLRPLLQDSDGKIVLVVADGLGGYADAEHASELEEATTPNLDVLAAEGSTGLVTPVAAGVPVNTPYPVSRNPCRNIP